LNAGVKVLRVLSVISIHLSAQGGD
jgi:hypothetical protein